MTSSGNHSPVEQIQDAPVSNPFKSSNSSSQISGPLPAQGSSVRSRVSFSAGTPTGEPTSFMGHSRQPSTASSFNFQQNRASSFHPSAGAMTLEASLSQARLTFDIARLSNRELWIRIRLQRSPGCSTSTGRSQIGKPIGFSSSLSSWVFLDSWASSIRVTLQFLGTSTA